MLQEFSEKEHLRKILIPNQKGGFECTVWHTIHQLADDKIVIILKEQEYFTCPMALEKINKYYEANIWMTAGFVYDLVNSQRLSWQDSYDLLSKVTLRKPSLCCLQPISFYAWLFKQIKLQDFIGPDNKFYTHAFFYAYTYPLVEMAQSHIACCNDLVITSEKTEIDEEFIYQQEIISGLPSYQRLEAMKTISKQPEQADLIVFSFDRPLQLYAFLESVECYVQGLSSVSVVYRISNKEMKKAYKKVKKRFTSVSFIEQSLNRPKADFKEKTMNAISGGLSNYLVFAVDDIIVKNYVNITDCTRFLKMTQAHGFYLRLGTNITYCYMNKRSQNIPELFSIENIYAWRFRGAQSDWCCMNTVDMTIYAREKIVPILENLNFTYPNDLEGEWCNSANKYGDLDKLGLCYEQSKIVNIPMNQVQYASGCRLSMNISVQDLLKKFQQGYKIDIKSFDCIENNSPHMEYMPRFIDR